MTTPLFPHVVRAGHTTPTGELILDHPAFGQLPRGHELAVIIDHPSGRTELVHVRVVGRTPDGRATAAPTGRPIEFPDYADPNLVGALEGAGLGATIVVTAALISAVIVLILVAVELARRIA